MKRKRNAGMSEEKGGTMNKEGEPVLHVHLLHPVETQSPAEWPLSRVAPLFETITQLLLYLEVISFSHFLNVNVCLRILAVFRAVFCHRSPNWGLTTENSHCVNAIIADAMKSKLFLSRFVCLVSQKTAVLIRSRRVRSMSSTSVSETWGGRYGKHSSPSWPKLLGPTKAQFRHSWLLVLSQDLDKWRTRFSPHNILVQGCNILGRMSPAHLCRFSRMHWLKSLWAVFSYCVHCVLCASQAR